MAKERLYLVREHIVPEIARRVLRVKEYMLSEGLPANEACARLNVSRSAYYKYRDAILPFYGDRDAHILRMLIYAQDRRGLLSQVLDCLSLSGANILTINQDYPVDGRADVSLVLDVKELRDSQEEVLARVSALEGVLNVRVLERREVQSGPGSSRRPSA